MTEMAAQADIDAASPDTGELFVAPEFVAHPIDRDRVLVFTPVLRGCRVLSRSAAAELDVCRQPASLQDHAAAIRARLATSDASSSAIVARLRSMADAGLLVSFSTLAARTARRLTECAPIEIVGWPTRDRPVALRHSIDSYRTNWRNAGRDVEVLVIDDTRDTDVASMTRELLAANAGGDCRKMLYADRRVRRQYASALSKKAGLPLDIVLFALLGDDDADGSIGATRNCLLAHTAGRALLMADDDTSAHSAIGPAGATFERVTLSCGSPCETWFFPDRASANRAARPIATDILADHERLLGRTAVHVVGRRAEDGAGSTPCSHLRRSIETGSGRVVATLNGIVGDSGMHSSWRLLALEGPSRDRLIASRTDYDTAFGSREVVRTASTLAISHHGPSLTTVVGLDNRSLVPPFVPVLRGSDGVFGALVSRCFADAYFGHIPTIVRHDAEAGRSYAARLPSRRTALRFCDVMSWLVTALSPCERVSDGERVVRLGTALEEIGTLPLGDFRRCIVEHVRKMADTEANRLEHLRTLYADSPLYWTNDIDAAIRFWQVDARSGAELASDIPWRGSSRAHAELAQRWVRQYGTLLRVWPRLIEGAKGLADGDGGLARPIGT